MFNYGLSLDFFSKGKKAQQGWAFIRGLRDLRGLGQGLYNNDLQVLFEHFWIVESYSFHALKICYFFVKTINYFIVGDYVP